jgi:hypothetical protein
MEYISNQISQKNYSEGEKILTTLLLRLGPLRSNSTGTPKKNGTSFPSIIPANKSYFDFTIPIAHDSPTHSDFKTVSVGVQTENRDKGYLASKVILPAQFLTSTKKM